MDQQDADSQSVLTSASQELLALVQEAGGLGIFQWQVPSGKLLLSAKFLSMYGLEGFDGHYESWLKCVYREDIPRIVDVTERAFADHERESLVEFRIVRPSDGAVAWMEARGINFYDADGRPVRVVGLYIDITERKRAVVQQQAFTASLEEAVMATRASEERFRALIEASAQIVWTTAADGAVVEDSPTWRAFTGQTYEQWKGWGWLDAFHPEDRDRVRELWRKAVAEKSPVATEYRLRHVSGEWRWTTARAVPVFDASGSVQQWIGMNIDVTAQKRAEERRDLLMRELQHRTGNLFSVVQSVAARTLSDARSLHEAQAVLAGRLQALSRAQGWLESSGLKGASLLALVEAETNPFPKRVSIEGPSVDLNPRAAQTLALVIHELMTNATKYGAFSSAHGRVSVAWSLAASAGEDVLRFSWRERDGPTVSPPTRRGFGRTIIELIVSQEFQAEPTICFAPDGLSYEIEVPVAALRAEPA